MPRTASESGAGSAESEVPVVRLLAPGTGGFRLYLLLSLLAGALVLGGAGALIPAPTHPMIVADPVLIAVAAYFTGLWVVRWASLRHMARPLPVQAQPGYRVGVATSFVPELESLPMLEQTLRRLVAMEYPHETWVLDEGDAEEVRQLCTRLGANHFSRRHDPAFRTPDGRYADGTKHGNYNAWLDRVGPDRYDLVALFDPDHVPAAGYLLETVGYFRDPAVGYVQAPQVYYNQDASFIARGAAEETYRYYSSGLLAGYGLGHTVVIGSHSVHRVRALTAVGGLPSHDAEDLYLTREYQAAGWQGVFVPRILSMGIAPVDWAGYLSQQRRWARAILDLKLRPAPDPKALRTLKSAILNFFHGANYFRPLALVLLYAMMLGLLLTNSVPATLTTRSLLALGGVALGLVLIGRFDDRFLLDPLRERGWRWRAAALQVAKAPHFVAALVDVLLNRRVRYVITPKTGPGSRAHPLAFAHVGIAAVTLGTLGAAVGRWGARLDPVLLAIGVGLGLVSLGLAWTDFLDYPPPFEPGRFIDRLRRLETTMAASRVGEGDPAQ